MDFYSFVSEYIDFLEKKLIYEGHELRDLKLEFHEILIEKFNEFRKY